MTKSFMNQSRILLLIIVFAYAPTLNAQDSILTSQFKNKTIQRVTKLLTDNYVFDEWEINSLGYQYFNKENGQGTAAALLKVNTILYPKSANTFDSYSEILAANKKIDLAILNSEKAVFLGKQNNDKNLNLYKENLERIKKLRN